MLSGGAGSRALNRVFQSRYGISGAMDAIDASGKTDPAILREIFLSRIGREPEVRELDEVLAAYVPLLIEELVDSPGFRTMPAILEAVAFLEACPGVHLGLATGNCKAGAKAKLDRISVWERFPTGGFGCDSGDRAVLVQRAIERGRHHAGVEVPSEDIIVVGDTIRDIAAARASGVKVIAVATGKSKREELAAADPDAVFETLAELPQWHERYCARRRS